MTIFSAFLISLSLSTVVFAAPTQRKISVNILSGELRTQFKIDSALNTIVMTNSMGLQRSRKIKGEDFDFLLGLTKKLPVPQRIPHDCYRARMDVEVVAQGAKSERKVSCFGVKTITSTQYQRFANLLAVSI